MPRIPRLEIPGVAYHVTARGSRRCEVFRDDFDRIRFLLLLEEVRRRFRWSCVAYCLMTTHYHLIIELSDPTLASGMAILNGRYARAANTRHDASGHLFGERYHAAELATEGHRLEAYRYVAQNPVRAGLVRRAEDWPWSSHRHMIGRDANERPIVTLTPPIDLTRSEDVGRLLLARFVNDGARRTAADWAMSRCQAPGHGLTG